MSSPKRAKVDDESTLAPARVSTVIAYADITKNVLRVSQRTDAERIARTWEWKEYFSFVAGRPHHYQGGFQEIIQMFRTWGIHAECDKSHEGGSFDPNCAVDIFLKAAAIMWFHGVKWSDQDRLPTPPQTYWMPPATGTATGPSVELPDDIWRTIIREYLYRDCDRRAVARASSRLVKLFLLPALARSAQRISALVNKLEQRDK